LLSREGALWDSFWAVTAALGPDVCRRKPAPIRTPKNNKRKRSGGRARLRMVSSRRGRSAHISNSDYLCATLCAVLPAKSRFRRVALCPKCVLVRCLHSQRSLARNAQPQRGDLSQPRPTAWVTRTFSSPVPSPEGAPRAWTAPSGLEGENQPVTQAAGLGCARSPLRGSERPWVEQHTYRTLPKVG